LKYDGKQFLFKLDESGKPVVMDYVVKPTEVIPTSHPTSRPSSSYSGLERD